MKLIRRSLACLLFLSVVLMFGCGQSSTPAKEDDGPVNPFFNEDPKGPAEGGIIRKSHEPIIQNDLRQIALLYQMYVQERRQPPQTVKDFLKYIERDAANLKKAIENEKYVVIPKVRLDSHGIIAYERLGSAAGNHFVVKTDGAPQEMTNAELQQELKKITGNEKG